MYVLTEYEEIDVSARESGGVGQCGINKSVIHFIKQKKEKLSGSLKASIPLSVKISCECMCDHFLRNMNGLACMTRK
jgi:hypothetical protein